MAPRAQGRNMENLNCKAAHIWGWVVTLGNALSVGLTVISAWSPLSTKEGGAGKKERREVLPGRAWVGAASSDACIAPSQGRWSFTQCVEELEDDVFQPEDGEPGAQPRRLLSADLFAQSQLDCPSAVCSSSSHALLWPWASTHQPGRQGYPDSQPSFPEPGCHAACGVTEEPQRLLYGECLALGLLLRDGEKRDFPSQTCSLLFPSPN